MKTIIIISILFIGAALVIARPKLGKKADLIDETQLPDGLYHIQSAQNGNLLLGAMVHGDASASWLGNITLEGHDPNVTIPKELTWGLYKDTCQCYEGEVYLNRHILTQGPNWLNSFDCELPGGNGSFYVERLWRLRNWGDGLVAINNVPFWNFGLDDGTCAQTNGESEQLKFAPCDESDVRQQFKFVSAETV